MRKKNKFFYGVVILGLILVSFYRDLIFPDETRYAYIASSIKSIRDFFLIKYAGDIYLEKGPLYFWLIFPVAKFLPINFFLPLIIGINILIGGAILWLNKCIIEKEDDSRISRGANLLVVSNPLFIVGVSIVRMDLLFLFFILLSFYFLYQIYLQKEDKIKYYFGLSLSIVLSIMTKGFLGAIYILLCGVILFIRNKRKFYKFLFFYFSSIGIIIFLMLLFYDKSLIRYIWKTQIIQRVFAPNSHYEGILFYLPRLVFFLPGLIISLIYIFMVKGPHKKWEKLYFCWFLVGFLVLSLIKTKVDIYLLSISLPILSLGGGFFRENTSYRFIRIISGIWVLILFITFIFTIHLIPKDIFLESLLVLGCVIIFLVYSMFMRDLERAIKSIVYGFVISFLIGGMTICTYMSKKYGLEELAKFIKKEYKNINKIIVLDRDILSLKLYGIEYVELTQNYKESNGKEGALLISKVPIEHNGLVYKNKRVYVYKVK